MATFASQLNYTPKVLDDYAREKNMTPYIPGITSPSVAQAPAPANVASALRAPVRPAAPAPRPAPVQAPVPQPAPSYDFSRDALMSQTNASGQTAQDMGAQAQNQMQARVLSQSMSNPGTLATGAQMGMTQQGTPINYQAYTQTAQPQQPSGPTYYDPIKGGMVSGDINADKPWEKYGVSSQNAYYNTDPATLQALALRNAGGNTAAISNYKPMVALAENGKFGVSEAGLIAPKRADYATLEDFQGANDEYNMARLQEQYAQATSPEMANARMRQDEYATREMLKAKESTAAYSREEQRQKNNRQREALLQSFALRGLTPETDESARNKLSEFDALAAKAEDAAAAAGMTSYAEAMGQARLGSTQRQNDLVKSISEQIKASVDALQTKKKADIDWAKLSLAEKKAEVDQAYKEGRITLAERDLARKEMDTVATVDLKEAQTAGTEAKTERTETLTPLEAEKMKAGTAKTQAETTRIETLTPLQAKSLAAKISKMSAASTGGGKVSTDDTTAAYEFHVATYGTKPTDKDLAAGVSYLRATGQLETPAAAAEKLVGTQKSRRDTLGIGVKAPSATDAALDSLVNGI